MTSTNMALSSTLMIVLCLSVALVSAGRVPVDEGLGNAEVRYYGYRGGRFNAEADAKYHAQGGGNMDGWSSSDDDKWHRAGNPYPEGYDKNGKIDGYEVDSDDADADAEAEAEQDLTFLGMRVALQMRKKEFSVQKQSEFRSFFAEVAGSKAEHVRIIDVSEEGMRRAGSMCSLKINFAIGVPSEEVTSAKEKLSEQNVQAALSSSPPEGMSRMDIVAQPAVLDSEPAEMLPEPAAKPSATSGKSGKKSSDNGKKISCELIGAIIGGVVLFVMGGVLCVKFLKGRNAASSPPGQPMDSAAPGGYLHPPVLVHPHPLGVLADDKRKGSALEMVDAEKGEAVSFNLKSVEAPAVSASEQELVEAPPPAVAVTVIANQPDTPDSPPDSPKGQPERQ